MEAVVADIFKKFDIDGSGDLSTDDFKTFYSEISAKRPDLGLTPEGYDAWFKSLDKDGSGTLSPQDLSDYLVSINYSA